MITINTFSNFGNQPVTIQIDGTTPNELTLSGLKIEYGDNEVGEYIIDWKGSITFFGRTELYDQFGTISFKSHKISIQYGSDKQFVGYLLPEVYTVPNTGFEENITLNFESSLASLDNVEYDGSATVKTINDILDDIQSKSDIASCVGKYSFTSPAFADILVYNGNFINDDGDTETYYFILENICRTFGLKCLMGWDNILHLTSCELLNGSDPYPLENHLGIDEDYSVGKEINNVSLTVSNYQYDGIEFDMSFEGGTKIEFPENQRNMPKMRVRQRERKISFNSSKKYIYEREIYQFPTTKSWKLNKWTPSGTILNDTDRNDPSKYLINENIGGVSRKVPLSGAYPIVWQTYKDNNTSAEIKQEQCIWLKNFHGIGGNSVTRNEQPNYISLYEENFFVKPSTFFFFNFEYAIANASGQLTDYNPQKGRGYIADADYSNSNLEGYSPYISECFVPISPNNTSVSKYWYVRFEIKFTDYMTGTTKWWDRTLDSGTGGWVETSTFFSFGPLGSSDIDEFEFKSTPSRDNLTVKNSDGTVANFEESVSSLLWFRMPDDVGVPGTLEINIGFMGEMSNLLFRDLQFNMLQSVKGTLNEKDLTIKEDVIYTNTESNKTDKSDTFQLYSYNPIYGKGQMFYKKNPTENAFLDKINFQSATEKPEHHFIRLATKWESKAKTYNDIIEIDNTLMAWDDRFFNGGSFDLIEGIANVQLISANQNIGGEL